MKKYAIAYLSLFENENNVFITQGDDPVSAFKNFCINEMEGGKYRNDKDWAIWVNNAGSTVDELKGTFINADIAIDIKEIN